MITYVQSDCGTDSSSWSGPLTFNTAFACPPNAVCATYTAGSISTDYSFTYQAFRLVLEVCQL